MIRRGFTVAAFGMLVAVVPLAVQAQADVREGVDAWSRGDYSRAVDQWNGPAEAGDPDAMFNLAQAYRLGQGVARDAARAEDLYRRAALSGHLQAADTYGLMLFQSGRKEEALPFIQDSARRGDPRSQYLLGVAHFNGDMVERDWGQAYALVTLAQSAGLSQASSAIAEMDAHIPLEQRQAAVSLAEVLRREADAARTAEFASADLNAGQSVRRAQSAVAGAGRASGTESPADAGASFARPDAMANGPASSRPPAPAPARQFSTVPASPTVQRSGPWKVQLGAFSVAGNAERLWERLHARGEIAGRERLLVPAGRVVKLQAGGYATRDEANAACQSLQNSGQDCLVTR